MTSRTIVRNSCAHKTKFLVALAALSTLSACASSTSSLLTGSINEESATAAIASSEPNATVKPTAAKPASGSKSRLAELQRQNIEAPTAAGPALAYAHALKATGQLKEARQVLTTAHAGPNSTGEVAGSLGLIELELGQTQKAQKLLQQATSSGATDWRYLSGLGVAYSIQGKQTDAQKHFKKALVAAPGNKSILNNLAMSLMLDRKLEQAEALLTQAKTGEAAPVEAAQNLILASRLREHKSNDAAAIPTTANSVVTAN